MKTYEIYINLIYEYVMPLHLLRQFQRAFTGPPCSISIRGSYGDHVRLNVISQPGCLPISWAVKPPKVRHHLKIICWKLRTCSLSLSLSLVLRPVKYLNKPGSWSSKNTFDIWIRYVLHPACSGPVEVLSWLQHWHYWYLGQAWTRWDGHPMLTTTTDSVGFIQTYPDSCCWKKSLAEIIFNQQ